MKNAIKDFTNYSAVEIAARDFDGDGKTEIAVIYRDNVTDVKLNTEYILGKINVSICKWNNGPFKKESAKVSYDAYNYTPQVTTVEIAGIVGLRADFDGDGKDELAVLLIAFSYSHQSGLCAYEELNFCPYLVRWYCEKNSITPKHDA